MEWNELQASPIVIGITGHRDLREEDRPMLTARVGESFDKVRGLYPDTPIIVLSSLAEGADRLVAEIAIERGFDLIALLPMPREEYLKDYETEQSRGEFHTLLAQATSCVEIPLVPGNTLENIQGWTENRMKQYIYVGAYTARHSHILLTLWNGVDNKLPGGTADVVKYKDTGIPEGFEPVSNIDSLEPVQGGIVYHVITPRRSNPETVGEPWAVVEYFYK